MSGPKLGPTGKHPFGKVHEDDDGEIQMGLAADHANGTVILNFGASISWIGLYPAQAKELAQAMIAKADELLKGAS